MAFRTVRQRRYRSMINSGLLEFESYELSGVKYSEAPYLRKLMRDRLRIKTSFDKQADLSKWKRTRREEEYREVIKIEYRDNNWLRERKVRGRKILRASPWEMLRDYRQKAIDRGEYHPVKHRQIVKRGDKIYIHIYKGDVQAQKRRAKERMGMIKGTSDYERYLEQRREQKARARQRAKEKRQASEH